MHIDKAAGIFRFFRSRTASKLFVTLHHRHCTIPTIFLVLGGVFIPLLLGAPSVHAANVYVRAGATGSNNGVDWINAYTNLPASLVRGNTYVLAGGSYPGRTFSDSGTSTITIRKASAALGDSSIAGWNSAYESTQVVFNGGFTFTQGYYTIDGITGGGPGSWESNFGFKISTNYRALFFNAPNISNITVRHTDIVGGGAGAPQTTICDLVYSLYRVNNLTISYSFLRDTNRTMILSWPSGFTNVLIEYSKFARNTMLEHAEAWSAGTDSNVVVRYNIFEDINATGFIVAVNGQGDATNWDIYGNIFQHTTTSGFVNSWLIGTRYDSPSGSPVGIRAVNWRFHNNVIAGVRGWGGGNIVFQGSPSGNYAYNNVFINNHTDSIGFAGVTADYNWYYNNYGYTNPGQEVSPSSSGNNIKGTSDPFTNSAGGNFIPIVPIPGLALASTYNTDPLGVIRGADGVWDRGAYEYISGGPPSPPKTPNPPTILQIN